MCYSNTLILTIGVKKNNFGMTKNLAVARSRKSRIIQGKIQLQIVSLQLKLIFQIVSKKRTTLEQFVITAIRKTISFETAPSSKKIMQQKISNGFDNLYISNYQLGSYLSTTCLFCFLFGLVLRRLIQRNQGFN